MAQISPRVKSLQFLHPPFHPSTIMGHETWETWPFRQGLLPSPLPPEELEGLLRDPRDFTRIISLLGSRHQPDLILKLGFGENSWPFLSPLKLEGVQLVRIGMTWLVASWISCMFTGRFEWIREGCMASSCVTSWIKWPHDVSCSLHLGVHRKLLEDMDRRLGPSVTWCCKVVKGPGMVGWITWGGKSEIHLTFAGRKMPFCWFPTKQRSELKTCPGDAQRYRGFWGHYLQRSHE